MPGNSQQKIKRVTIIYWMLLFYIVAALAWWFISLENQNRKIQHLKEELSILQQQQNGRDNQSTMAAIKAEGDRNNAKYLGEGVAFLILIMVGAFFVFRSVRRQFYLQQQQLHLVQQQKQPPWLLSLHLLAHLIP